MLLTVVLAKTLESPLDCKEIQQYILKEISPEYHWKDWCWSWNSNTLATWWEELTHWKRPWCWERLKVGGEGIDRAWDGCMASPTQWTWIWVNSGHWSWIGRPSVLHSMGLQRIGHDWATELNWTDHPTYGVIELINKRDYILKASLCTYPEILNLETKTPWERFWGGSLDQSWVFIGRTDAKAETPVLWPPHAKSWLIGKDSDAGRDWGQEEKGMTEDEMAGWHHGLDGHESEWTPGVGDGQGGLACCDSWDRKESDMTEWLNWTELNCENVRCLRPVIIHRGKYKNLSSVMEPMVLIMNFFFYHRLNLHQFGEFGGQD